MRIWGIGFGLPHVGARPDEPQIAGPAVGFLSGDLRPPYLEWPTLFATSPYVLIDWPRVVRALTATQSMFLSGHSIVLGRGWWYYASVVLPAAVGWPIFLAGVTGTCLLLVTRFRQAAVVVAFPIAYYIVAGRGLGVFARYILPVVPFLCLAAAWLLVQAVRWATRKVSPTRRRVAMVAATMVMLAPTAYKSVLLDRLLARPDNREIAGRALNDILPPGSLFYQSGESYGHVPLNIGRRRTDLRVARFDPVTGRFRPEEPGWILVQRSPLVVYSGVHPAIEQLLREHYVLVRRFPTESDPTVARTYDQQDAFFIPLSGLEGIRRPGPAFDLYARRQP